MKAPILRQWRKIGRRKCAGTLVSSFPGIGRLRRPESGVSWLGSFFLGFFLIGAITISGVRIYAITIQLFQNMPLQFQVSPSHAIFYVSLGTGPTRRRTHTVGRDEWTHLPLRSRVKTLAALSLLSPALTLSPLPLLFPPATAAEP